MTLRFIYMLPMILGRTYDLTTHTVGIDIFPPETLQKTKVIAETDYDSSYKTIESSSDVKTVLGIKGDLSLKIKGNTFSLKGMGSYLKETLDTEKSVETLIKVSFRTYSQSLPPSLQPAAHWRTMGSDFLGTHYVQSVIYGGDLIASVTFKAVKSEYLQKIRGSVKTSLEAGNALKLVADGKLEMLEKELKGMANVEVNYFATVPLEGVPNSLQGLRELVMNFQAHVKKVNNGWGVPVEVELGELATFDSKFQYLKNSLLEAELNFFEESFDDLLVSKSRLKNWATSLPVDLPKEIEEKIDSLRERISGTLRVFYDVISGLDMTDGPEQLRRANIAYRENGKSDLPGKFERELSRLIKRTEIKSENAPERGSSVYTAYGKTECSTSTKTSTIFSGYLASSRNDAKGAGVNYICLPKKPQGFQNVGAEVDGSYLQGVKYGLLEDTELENEQELILKGVVCSMCLAHERTTVVTFPDTRACPEDGDWTEEYSGFFMSANTVNRAQTVCFDKSPEMHTEGDATPTDQSLNAVQVLTEGKPQKRRLVPCVVCSK